MAEQTLSQKFQIKDGYSLLVFNAPSGYAEKIGSVDTERKNDAIYDFVAVFVSSKAEIDNLAPKAMAAVRPDGLLWFLYPKKTSGIKTDIHRDVGWDILKSAGWDGVRAISLDNIWSGLRFRRVGDINYTANSTRKPK